MNLVGFGVDGLMLVLLSFGIVSFIGMSFLSFIFKCSVKLVLVGVSLILVVSVLVLMLWGSDKIIVIGVVIIWGLIFVLVFVGWLMWIICLLVD